MDITFDASSDEWRLECFRILRKQAQAPASSVTLNRHSLVYQLKLHRSWLIQYGAWAFSGATYLMG